MSDDRTGGDPPGPRSTDAPGPRSPTRRRLLALLALAPVPAVADAAPSTPAPPDDPIPPLFAQFEALTAAHERALARVDRLEASLVARLGWPRVRLPAPPGAMPLFGADFDTADRHVPQGPLARRLKRACAGDSGTGMRRRAAWRTPCGTRRAYPAPSGRWGSC